MSSARTGAVFALAAAFGFSFKAIFVKLAYVWPIDAVTLLALRMLFAFPVFALIAVRSSMQAQARARPLEKRDLANLLFLGLLGYYGASVLDFIGLQYISPGLERLILFTYPMLTMLFAVIVHGKRLDRREIASLILCYAGVALAFAHDLQFTGDARAVLIGGAFVFGSSLTFAMYLTGSGAMITKLGATRFTALAMIVSTAGTLVHYALAEPLHALVDQPWPVYALAAGMAVVSTILPVFLQSAAIRRVGASRSALIGTIGPMLTIFFSWWLLEEQISLWQIAGAALVVSGVLQVASRSAAE